MRDIQRPAPYRSCFKQYATKRTRKGHDNVLLPLTHGPNRTSAQRDVSRQGCIMQQTAWRDCDIKHTGVMYLTYILTEILQSTQSFLHATPPSATTNSTSVHQGHLWVLYDNKQQLLASSALTDWFLKWKQLLIESCIYFTYNIIYIFTCMFYSLIYIFTIYIL